MKCLCGSKMNITRDNEQAEWWQCPTCLHTTIKLKFGLDKDERRGVHDASALRLQEV